MDSMFSLFVGIHHKLHQLLTIPQRNFLIMSKPFFNAALNLDWTRWVKNLTFEVDFLVDKQRNTLAKDVSNVTNKRTKDWLWKRKYLLVFPSVSIFRLSVGKDIFLYLNSLSMKLNVWFELKQGFCKDRF